MDFNNIVLRKNGQFSFPDEVDDAVLVDSYLVARGNDGEEALVNPNVPGMDGMKTGGIDGCVLEPMDGVLPASMVDEVRGLDYTD